jgi:hypothetical protein
MSTRWPTVRDSFQPTHRLALLLLGQGVWMLATLGALFAFELFSLQTYFVVSFVGLLGVAQVYAPVGSKPGWWSFVRLVLVACHVVFAAILYRRVSEIVTLA